MNEHRSVQHKREERPEICIFENLTYDQGGILKQWRKEELFNKGC